MIYNNLLFFLAAIFLFSMATVPSETMLSAWIAAPSFLLVFGIFDWIVRYIFLKQAAQETSGYFRAEKRASILALLFFVVLVFGLDLKYYLSFLSFRDTVPAFVNIGGLIVFLFLFVIMWRRARKCYEVVFSRQYRSRAFIFSNIKANLPIVIPWVILTLFYDVINLMDWPWLHNLVNSEWGDVVFFGVFILFVFIFFPPLVRRLWGCKELGEGPLKDHLTAFCKSQNLSASIYLWPLFEGRVITAGVMGIIPGLRYILITPALIDSMNVEELDSVMAHEIGHVKRFHLPLYVFLIGGFIVTSGFLGEPLFYFFFAKDYFYSFIEFSGFSPDAIRNVAMTVPALIYLLLFFRFVFGYFMRNFERQADLHVFPVLGDSRAIISAFEKIALLSGNVRNKPSWHHFGIGQRVDYLQKCEKHPTWINRQHKKVKLSLGIYIIVITTALFISLQIPIEESRALFESKYTRADLIYNAEKVEHPALWLQAYGDAFVQHKMESSAIIAYELAMDRESNHPDILNKFAWLLLTSEDMNLRNPKKALNLSRTAAVLKPRGYILDTLAVAWWANGFAEKAIKTERQALFADPLNSSYYKSQVERFRRITYAEEMEKEFLKDTMNIPGGGIDYDFSTKI